MVKAVKNQPTVDVIQKVQNYVETLEKNANLKLPRNYSVVNALMSARMVLQGQTGFEKRPVLQGGCTEDSIFEALLNMILQGLNPATNQCYFIANGNQLQMRRSYFGTVSVLKQLHGVADVKAQVVHEGDGFEIGANEDFETVVTKFVPKFANQDKKIIAAFAIIFFTDGHRDYTIMTEKEIREAWRTSNNNYAQQHFPQEMAKRTVLNRAAKMYVNTADDQVTAGAIASTTAQEYEPTMEPRMADAKQRADQIVARFKQKRHKPTSSGEQTESKVEKSTKTATRSAEKAQPTTSHSHAKARHPDKSPQAQAE